MSLIHARIAQIRRPRLLLSAARFGLSDFDRAATLPRLVSQPAPLDARCYLADLLELEDAQNTSRLNRDAGYRIARHVELLIALLAERDRAVSIQSDPSDAGARGLAPS